MSDALSIERLNKRFGGVPATDDVTLAVAEGEIHALIGPNGAGKTTLINQLSGELRPDSGRIGFFGDDITRLPVYRRAALGLARSFQITSVFPEFTVLENVSLAVQARSGHSFGLWRPVARERALREQALEVIGQTGLGGRTEVRARTLSHGERRQLEIALALATRPRVLLLDEPMAGMGREESRRMVTLLSRLRETYTVLLVEHDMDAVFRLADRISVLVYGRLIATGAPDEIRANELVQEAYLGHG
ncbi:MAG: ABC transporter ATP-binding protein [Pseudomonadota bacterium]|nr:ABC transporter ATP-binding protein [Pseudomonadota bacterium]